REGAIRGRQADLASPPQKGELRRRQGPEEGRCRGSSGALRVLDGSLLFDQLRLLLRCKAPVRQALIEVVPLLFLLRACHRGDLPDRPHACLDGGALRGPAPLPQPSLPCYRSQTLRQFITAMAALPLEVKVARDQRQHLRRGPLIQEQGRLVIGRIAA